MDKEQSTKKKKKKNRVLLDFSIGDNGAVSSKLKLKMTSNLEF